MTANNEAKWPSKIIPRHGAADWTNGYNEAVDAYRLAAEYEKQKRQRLLERVSVEGIVRAFSNSLTHMGMDEIKSNPSWNYVGLAYHLSTSINALIAKGEK